MDLRLMYQNPSLCCWLGGIVTISYLLFSFYLTIMFFGYTSLSNSWALLLMRICLGQSRLEMHIGKACVPWLLFAELACVYLRTY